MSDRQGRKWISDTFLIAGRPGGVMKMDGFTYAGLGIDKRSSGHWVVTHLNTGHKLCTLHGTWFLVSMLATELAECADWTFDGLLGWANRDPDLARKARAVIEKCPFASRDDLRDEDAEQARYIMRARS
jgi:hypothetical protein